MINQTWRMRLAVFSTSVLLATSRMALSKFVYLPVRFFSSSLILLKSSFLWVSKRSSTEASFLVDSCWYWLFYVSMASIRDVTCSWKCLFKSLIYWYYPYNTTKLCKQQDCSTYLQITLTLPDHPLELVNLELYALQGILLIRMVLLWLEISRGLPLIDLVS